jgi:hypothetical protein
MVVPTPGVEALEKLINISGQTAVRSEEKRTVGEG